MSWEDADARVLEEMAKQVRRHSDYARDLVVAMLTIAELLTYSPEGRSHLDHWDLFVNNLRNIE